MMHLLIPIALIVVVVAVIAVIAATRLSSERSAADSVVGNVYELPPSLLSPAERSFYGVLSSLNLEYDVSIKVRLADIVSVKRGLTASERQRALNRVSAKHVDFLLLRRSDCRPVVAIELDDASHGRQDREARDAFVDRVFTSCGLPILHIAARKGYDTAEIRSLISQVTNSRSENGARLGDGSGAHG